MANATEVTSNKRVQINITLTVSSNAEAVTVIDQVETLKAQHPSAVIESRIMDMGSRLLGIP